MLSIVGWDIGAANIKAARLAQDRRGVEQISVTSKPFEIWREKDHLPEVLQSVFAAVGSDRPPRAMALTMTAELSDIFTTKREGVLFVLECVRTCFPKLTSYALSISGEFVPLDEAQTRPLEFAATNWLASARWIAGRIRNCILVDVGSTTTDILPILNGQIMVSGRTDTERLILGELVYTGALRTNLAAIVRFVPVAGRICRVAAEHFAVSGDVHLILGNLQPEDYTCATPDGRPPSVASARRRLARLVCADTESLSATEIDEMARYICARQISQIREALNQVVSRIPELRRRPVVILGSGAFLGAAAASSAGLEIPDVSIKWGKEELAVAPCLAAAHLLFEHLKEG